MQAEAELPPDPGQTPAPSKPIAPDAIACVRNDSRSNYDIGGRFLAPKRQIFLKREKGALSVGPDIAGPWSDIKDHVVDYLASLVQRKELTAITDSGGILVRAPVVQAEPAQSARALSW